MLGPLVAETHYEDLLGSVSIEGYDGPLLRNLREHSNMPAEFIPIGFSFEATQREGSLFLSPYIIGIDAEVVGGDLEAYAKSAGKIPAFRFEVEGTFLESAGLIRRVKIVATDKRIGDVPVEIQNNN